MNDLVSILRRNQPGFHPIVPFDPSQDKLVRLDFSQNNNEPVDSIVSDIDLFSKYIDQKLEGNGSRYGIGGYGEQRRVYNFSQVFDAEKLNDEPRRFHLGLDIWGKAGTPVSAPLGGMVHSKAFNDRNGDYGATIILLHQLDGLPFYSLYGHLSKGDLVVAEGTYINRGQIFAHFGKPEENGHWPPHLHLQIIIDIEMKKGDYPGVCKFSERNRYLSNCPDPDLLANLQQFVL
jgi:peptidoglycan LD-endopeptidase LytH